MKNNAITTDLTELLGTFIYSINKSVSSRLSRECDKCWGTKLNRIKFLPKSQKSYILIREKRERHLKTVRDYTGHH